MIIIFINLRIDKLIARYQNNIYLLRQTYDDGYQIVSLNKTLIYNSHTSGFESLINYI